MVKSSPIQNVADTVVEQRVSNWKNSHIVRWYVLTLPGSHRGRAAELQAEVDRRAAEGEPVFEFFAPTYTKIRTVRGHEKNVRRPLLFNYVFIHASEAEIKRMKKRLPAYNFLPRVRCEGSEWFPYLTDVAMQNFRWVARAYEDRLPAYVPDVTRLVKGDRIRILEGDFAGVEATLVSNVGSSDKEIVVRVDDWLWVPLLHVSPGQYEVIALSNSGKHEYFHFDNEKFRQGLHLAMKHHLLGDGLTDADRKLVTEALLSFRNVQVHTDVMRCKHYAYLLIIHTLLGNDAERAELIHLIRSFLPIVKAEQSRALLYVTLYGCTNDHLDYMEAHALVSPWMSESDPKKSKRQLIGQLRDYDCWLGHA